jgi:hypothetical protein
MFYLQLFITAVGLFMSYRMGLKEGFKRGMVEALGLRIVQVMKTSREQEERAKDSEDK